MLGPAAPSAAQVPRRCAQVALVKQIERSQKEYAEGRRQRDKEILQLRRKVRPMQSDMARPGTVSLQWFPPQERTASLPADLRHLVSSARVTALPPGS